MESPGSRTRPESESEPEGFLVDTFNATKMADRLITVLAHHVGQSFDDHVTSPKNEVPSDGTRLLDDPGETTLEGPQSRIATDSPGAQGQLHVEERAASPDLSPTTTSPHSPTNTNVADDEVVLRDTSSQSSSTSSATSLLNLAHNSQALDAALTKLFEKKLELHFVHPMVEEIFLLFFYQNHRSTVIALGLGWLIAIIGHWSFATGVSPVPNNEVFRNFYKIINFVGVFLWIVFFFVTGMKSLLQTPLRRCRANELLSSLQFIVEGIAIGALRGAGIHYCDDDTNNTPVCYREGSMNLILFLGVIGVFPNRTRWMLPIYAFIWVAYFSVRGTYVWGVVTDTDIVASVALPITYTIAMIVVNGAKEYLLRKFFEAIMILEIRQRLVEQSSESLTQLLDLMLPPTVLARMLAGAQVWDQQTCTILSSDIAGFTQWCRTKDSKEVVQMLTVIVEGFDAAAQLLSVVRVRTAGDGYLACCGLPLPEPEHAYLMTQFAQKQQSVLKRLRARSVSCESLALRIGIHSGPVLGALLSDTRWSYDVLGPVPDFAHELEIACEANSIYISETTRKLLPQERQVFFSEVPPRIPAGSGPLSVSESFPFRVYQLDKSFVSKLNLLAKKAKQNAKLTSSTGGGGGNISEICDLLFSGGQDMKKRPRNQDSRVGSVASSRSGVEQGHGLNQALVDVSDGEESVADNTSVVSETRSNRSLDYRTSGNGAAADLPGAVPSSKATNGAGEKPQQEHRLSSDHDDSRRQPTQQHARKDDQDRRASAAGAKHGNGGGVVVADEETTKNDEGNENQDDWIATVAGPAYGVSKAMLGIILGWQGMHLWYLLIMYQDFSASGAIAKIIILFLFNLGCLVILLKRINPSSLGLLVLAYVTLAMLPVEAITYYDRPLEDAVTHSEFGTLLLIVAAFHLLVVRSTPFWIFSTIMILAETFAVCYSLVVQGASGIIWVKVLASVIAAVVFFVGGRLGFVPKLILFDQTNRAIAKTMKILIRDSNYMSQMLQKKVPPHVVQPLLEDRSYFCDYESAVVVFCRLVWPKHADQEYIFAARSPLMSSPHATNFEEPRGDNPELAATTAPLAELLQRAMTTVQLLNEALDAVIDRRPSSSGTEADPLQPHISKFCRGRPGKIYHVKTMGDTFLLLSHGLAKRSIDNAVETSRESSIVSIPTSAATSPEKWTSDVESAKELLFFLSHLVKLIVARCPEMTIDCGASLGPLTVAVLGTQQIEYDVFGTTVNTASRALSSLSRVYPNLAAAAASSKGATPSAEANGMLPTGHSIQSHRTLMDAPLTFVVRSLLHSVEKRQKRAVTVSSDPEHKDNNTSGNGIGTSAAIEQQALPLTALVDGPFQVEAKGLGFISLFKLDAEKLVFPRSPTNSAQTIESMRLMSIPPSPSPWDEEK